MIITLTGENSFAIAEAQQQLISAFAAKHNADSIERVDAEELEASRLPDLLQGATLFAPVRLVILKDVSINKPLHESLVKALEQVADGTTVVIVDAALDKRTKLYKFLKAHSTFKDLMPLTEAQLIAWLQKRAKSLEATLDTDTARYLLQRAGHDQWRLRGELEKLANYHQPITRQTIDELVEATPEASAFELLDTALAGKGEEVARIIAALKVQEDPYRLFGLVASQVYAVAVVAAAEGRSADQVAKESGLHPYVVRKMLGSAKRLSHAQVTAMAEAVAVCDFQLKSTGADPWQLIQAALGKVAKRKE